MESCHLVEGYKVPTIHRPKGLQCFGIANVRAIDECRNPRIRGAAAEALVESLQQMLPKLTSEGTRELCGEGLLAGLVPLLSDNTPEARGSSRKALRILKVCLPQRLLVMPQRSALRMPLCGIFFLVGAVRVWLLQGTVACTT
jgi:hypothetical protein